MTKEETIKGLESIEERAVDFPYMTACDWGAIAAAKRHINEAIYKTSDVYKEELIDKACSGIEKLLSGYIIRNFHFGDSYKMDTLIEDFRRQMEE